MWVLTFARPVCILVLEARPVGTDGEHLLVASGWSPPRAAAMALFALSAVEGALILRRAERSTQYTAPRTGHGRIVIAFS